MNQEMLHELAELLETKKATDLKTMNMQEVTPLADYFLLANAGNKKHAQALADEATKWMKAHGMELLRENGYREGTWILQDFGDVIVHLFIPEERSFYDLDSMWGDAAIEHESSGE